MLWTSVQCSILGRPIPFTPTAKRPGTCIWSASQSPGIDSDASLIQCGWGRSELRTQSQRGTCTLFLAAFLTKLRPASLDPVPSSDVQPLECSTAVLATPSRFHLPLWGMHPAFDAHPRP